VILESLLDAGVEGVALAAIYDPAAVEAAVTAGVGERVSIELGGRIEGQRRPAPRRRDGSVALQRHLSESGADVDGLEVSFGRTAVLDVDGIDVIVGSHRQQPYDPEVFRSNGITPERKRVLVLKSTVHYRAAFEGLVGEFERCSHPGFAVPTSLVVRLRTRSQAEISARRFRDAVAT